MFGNLETSSCAERILSYTLVDELLSVPKAERVDWATLFRQKYGNDEEDDGVDDYATSSDHVRPQTLDALGVTMADIAGTYHNAGYKILVLEI